jgi:hypothetical protein
LRDKRLFHGICVVSAVTHGHSLVCSSLHTLSSPEQRDRSNKTDKRHITSSRKTNTSSKSLCIAYNILFELTSAQFLTKLVITVDPLHCNSDGHSPLSELQSRHVTFHFHSEFTFCWILVTHRGSYEEVCILGYNAEQSVESQATFRRNTLPPSSWLGSKPSKKPEWRRQQAVQRYMAPLRSLKPSVVLLLLYYKQTVTATVPLPSAYCSIGSDSHIIGVFCEVRTVWNWPQRSPEQFKLESESWNRKILSGVPRGPEPRMTVLEKASCNLPDPTRNHSPFSKFCGCILGIERSHSEKNGRPPDVPILKNI